MLASRFHEQHAPGIGLQRALHDCLDGSSDVASTILYHHHGAVIQIAYTLVDFLSTVDDLNRDVFTRYETRLDGIRELVHVKNGDPFDLSDAVEIVVSRDQNSRFVLG